MSEISRKEIKFGFDFHPSSPETFLCYGLRKDRNRAHILLDIACVIGPAICRVCCPQQTV